MIAGTVARCARRFGETSAELIDDLVQDTFLKLCANGCRILRDFRPQSPDAIFGFLKTVAFNATLDHFRGGMAEKRGIGLPEAEREILLREIDENMPPDASPRDRQIFWLYYRHGMTARAIGEIPGLGLTQKGVESVIQRLIGYVRGRVGPRKTERPEGKSSSGTF